MTTTAYQALLGKVHGIVVTRDLDVAVDGEAVRRIVETETERFQREATIGTARFEPFADPADIAERLVRDVEGVGGACQVLCVRRSACLCGYSSRY